MSANMYRQARRPYKNIYVFKNAHTSLKISESTIEADTRYVSECVCARARRTHSGSRTSVCMSVCVSVSVCACALSVFVSGLADLNNNGSARLLALAEVVV